MGKSMKKFNYTMNHEADEAYMAKMCHEGWLAFLMVLLLAIKVSVWFGILCVFVAVYAVMCVCLGTSYTRLLHRMRKLYTLNRIDDRQ